jgi:hypothetical protein
MNWLLYVGGWIILEVLSSYILSAILRQSDMDETGNVEFFVLAYLSTSMVWVWLMWRFVR